MKKINKFFIRKAQHSFLQRLLQRTSYATSIRNDIKNYHKNKHVVLLTSQYMRKFSSYVVNKKKKRNSTIGKISYMKYYYFFLGLSYLRQYVQRKKSSANNIVMTKSNTNKIRKVIQIWKKRIRLRNRYLTKINKARVKRRRLLCPKYLVQWISYLSSKILKHRQYLKLIKKVTLSKGWGMFLSNMQRILKNNKNMNYQNN
jgi:hypothetical protein